MAVVPLTEAEITYLTELHKQLVEKAKTVTPRAATHLRAAIKLHANFLAIENGKRVTLTQKAADKQRNEAEKLQRQQDRLVAMQEKYQKKAQSQGTDAQADQRGSRTKASASA